MSDQTESQTLDDSDFSQDDYSVFVLLLLYMKKYALLRIGVWKNYWREYSVIKLLLYMEKYALLRTDLKVWKNCWREYSAAKLLLYMEK